mmetsp:Transcript_83858/g.125719  ORF Transcript_83858/g.125719 Transcript_83858/m.125719 type:complete len:228 (+) Transcript_83858:126-809(+)
MIFVGPTIMKSLSLGPYNPQKLLNLWNLFLCFFSLVCVVRVGLITLPIFLDRGWYHVLVMPGDRYLWTGEAYLWVVIFCASKFLELIDTFFLVIRGKPVPFLHWYHHTTVLLYTWYSMVSGHSAGWIFGLINGCVHVFMYFYYFYSGITNTRPFWGKYITLLQLTQMVVGISITASWDYYYFSGYECPASWPEFGIIGGALMYLSYFILFLRFYTRRHSQHSPQKRD